MKKSETNGAVIEASPIRLSADETRIIWKLMQANGTPHQSYHGCSLVELGIAKKVAIPVKDMSTIQHEAWDRLAAAAKSRDKRSASAALSTIEQCERTVKQKEYGYVLTELGKQVARGLTVRWNSQYAPKDGCKA